MLVLMTGATGFLGSHLARGLLRDGHKVAFLKRSRSDCSRISDILPQLCAFDVDRADWEEQLEACGRIEAIIHAATSYGRQGESLAELVQSNVIFPLQLLELAIRRAVPFFLNTDTFSRVPSVLSSHLSGYNLTKRQFLEWGSLLASSSPTLRFRSLRLEHVYGPMDSANKFVPFVIRSCLQQDDELALTLGEQKRDFIYIDDVVSAFLTVLRRAGDSEEPFLEYEVGTGEATSVRDFVRLVHGLTASKTILRFGALPYAAHEIMLSQANTLPLEQLGWSPQTTLTDGIRNMIKRDTSR
ncbi:NAD-dependent epimerase/dehydratase family protein [Brevibacillus centrosporus]|uniref:Nucleoside-diphosphate-sugar epimerase n=1 Tax=Brevibacillus centrosporus TaxID=54910 RepID=A0A1I4AY97_9BACL|nr:NAD(P)-dependent oxidoreductase [Brevibacillus centrosporus]SFK60576.1 Nucleoside-diphosphate-sugar epimerase [Brevibacillus centrosporus]